MKSQTANLLLATLAIFLLALPAIAQNDIYDNGPTNGNTDAWTINFGFVVSDTFVIPNSRVDILGVNFAAWLFPGDVLQSAEVSVTSEEFGGITYFDQTETFTQSGCATNQYGFNVCNELGSIALPTMNAGTYWLNLQNAQVSSGNPVFWDESLGPSSASENSLGTIPSESFTIVGYPCQGCGCSTKPDCGPPPTTPEPGNFLLFGSGVLTLLGLLGSLRNKFL